MKCVSCGDSEGFHIRADGSCLGCACPAFLGKWPEEKPTKTEDEGHVTDDLGHKFDTSDEK